MYNATFEGKICKLKLRQPPLLMIYVLPPCRIFNRTLSAVGKIGKSYVIFLAVYCGHCGRPFRNISMSRKAIEYCFWSFWTPRPLDSTEQLPFEFPVTENRIRQARVFSLSRLRAHFSPAATRRQEHLRNSGIRADGHP